MTANKLPQIIIWLIVTITIFFYLWLYYYLDEITELLIMVIPALIFIFGGMISFSHNKKIAQKAKSRGEKGITKELNWGIAFKHDLLIYLAPVFILIIPIIFGQKTDMIDILQASGVFLVLSYIKILYWGKL